MIIITNIFIFSFKNTIHQVCKCLSCVSISVRIWQHDEKYLNSNINRCCRCQFVNTHSTFLPSFTGISPLESCFWWPVRSWRWMILQPWGRSWVFTPSRWWWAWCCMACSSSLLCTSSSLRRAPSSTSEAFCRPSSSPWPPPPGKWKIWRNKHGVMWGHLMLLLGLLRYRYK